MSKKISEFEVQEELGSSDFIPFIRQAIPDGPFENLRINAENLTVQNLGGIGDVELSNPQPQDHLVFGTGGKWINQAVQNNSVLVVNASNTANGDGSFANPFKTIDLVCDFIITNGLVNSNYTILVFGGTYTTSRNLSNGNAWFFFPGAKINFSFGSGSQDTRWLFDMNGSLQPNTAVSAAYDIQIYGHLEFSSSNGLFIKGRDISAQGSSAYFVQAKFADVRSSYSPSTDLGVIELYNYNPKDRMHTIEGDYLSGKISLVIGNSNTSIIGSHANVSVATMVGRVVINKQENVTQFKNCMFVYGTAFMDLKAATGGGLVLSNCRIVTNTPGAKTVFKVYDGFASNSASALSLMNVYIGYGSSAVPDSSGNKMTIFEFDSGLAHELKLETLFLRTHPNMTYSTSNASVADVTGKLKHLYLAGSVQYNYVYS